MQLQKGVVIDMLNEYIELGQRIELRAVTRVKLNEEPSVHKVYSSKVYDILSDERLEILMPVERSKLVLLSMDDEYELFFFGERGPYECKARIADRYKYNNVYILLMELTTNLKKYQRREYYRHTCAIDIYLKELTEEELVENEEKNKADGSFIKGVLVDISGGGMRFVAAHKFEKESIVLCRFTLLSPNGLKEYAVKGQVIDVKKLEKRPENYEHRVQYMNIPKEIREEIIRYIFEEERKKQKIKRESERHG